MEFSWKHDVVSIKKLISTKQRCEILHLFNFGLYWFFTIFIFCSDIVFIAARKCTSYPVNRFSSSTWETLWFLILLRTPHGRPCLAQAQLHCLVCFSLQNIIVLPKLARSKLFFSIHTAWPLVAVCFARKISKRPEKFDVNSFSTKAIFSGH